MLSMYNKLFPTIEFFIDDACRGNPGVGGWGVLLKTESQTKGFYGAEANTTNNRMELTAAIMAIKSLKLYSENHDITQSHIMIKAGSEMDTWFSRSHLLDIAWGNKSFRLKATSLAAIL